MSTTRVSYLFDNNDIQSYVNSELVRNKVNFENNLHTLHMINTQIKTAYYAIDYTSDLKLSQGFVYLRLIDTNTNQ